MLPAHRCQCESPLVLLCPNPPDDHACRETIRVKGSRLELKSSVSHALFCDKKCATTPHKGIANLVLLHLWQLLLKQFV